MRKYILISLLIFTTISIGAKEKVRNYKELTSFVESLNQNCTAEIISKLNYGKEEYSVYKIKYNCNKSLNQKKYLIITGVHGNEPAPVIEIRDFIIKLDKTTPIRKDLEIDFLYIVNPYGYEFDQRYNGVNKDINRDFNNYETEEAKIVKNNFPTKEYEKVFDFHEASSQKFFLYCYGIKNSSYAREILRKLQQEKVPLESEYKDQILQTDEGLLFVPFYAAKYMKIRNMETIGIYFRKCKNSFTFETPKFGKIEERRKIVKSILEYIIEH